MSDRSYIAMRAAARDPPQACMHAAATSDPYFNESFPMPLPPPEKRRYAHMASYRGYTIATYKDMLDEPVYHVDGVPIFVVYFALDDLGDSITPVDTCFWSPFLARAMIDIYVGMTEGERKAWWKRQGTWPMIHQNYSSQHHLPMLLDVMRGIAAECDDPDLDLLFGDASEFGQHIQKRIKRGLDTLHISPKPE
ncbi:hypothetical protein CPT_Suzuki_024 [Stenotrophomonas phage Suzuki]|nr:hypothetical protein CPT_Suzuki_024 [Stenotrophomonas phage Suzuki]